MSKGQIIAPLALYNLKVVLPRDKNTFVILFSAVNVCGDINQMVSWFVAFWANHLHYLPLGRVLLYLLV
jgi:hypothetical protein